MSPGAVAGRWVHELLWLSRSAECAAAPLAGRYVCLLHVFGPVCLPSPGSNLVYSTSGIWRRGFLPLTLTWNGIEPSFSAPPETNDVTRQRECFWVKHYAGKVKYTIGGWVERNMDSIPQSFNDTLATSTLQAS